MAHSLVDMSCCCLAAKSCLTLLGPHGLYPLGSSIHGISQARILKWVAVSSSRGSYQPRDRTCVSCIGRFSTTEPPGKPSRERKAPPKNRVAMAWSRGGRMLVIKTSDPHSSFQLLQWNRFPTPFHQQQLKIISICLPCKHYSLQDSCLEIYCVLDFRNFWTLSIEYHEARHKVSSLRTRTCSFLCSLPSTQLSAQNNHEINAHWISYWINML